MYSAALRPCLRSTSTVLSEGAEQLVMSTAASSAHVHQTIRAATARLDCWEVKGKLDSLRRRKAFIFYFIRPANGVLFLRAWTQGHREVRPLYAPRYSVLACAAHALSRVQAWNAPLCLFSCLRFDMQGRSVAPAVDDDLAVDAFLEVVDVADDADELVVS